MQSTLASYTSFIQFRNSSLIIYHIRDKDTKNVTNKGKFTAFNNTENPTYSGQTTDSNKKRIRKALDTLLQLTKKQRIYNPITKTTHDFRLAFITLTISSIINIDHSLAYNNLLKPFLDWLRKTKGNNLYLWKAELQKRGQIHYHITINSFIPHHEIRQKWNYLQAKNNLIQKGKTPPSTEIKAVKNIKNIENYLAKYISKAVNEEGKVYETSRAERTADSVEVLGAVISCFPSQTNNFECIKGKIWDCSDSLKCNKYFTLELKNDIAFELMQYVENDNPFDYIYLDNCTIVKSNESMKNVILTNDNKIEYENFKKATAKGEKYINPHTRIQLANVKKEKEEWQAYLNKTNLKTPKKKAKDQLKQYVLENFEVIC